MLAQNCIELRHETRLGQSFPGTLEMRGSMSARDDKVDIEDERDKSGGIQARAPNVIDRDAVQGSNGMSLRSHSSDPT